MSAIEDEDRISALPNDILLEILECLDLRAAIQASTVARRWRHLPYQLSHLLISVTDFHDDAGRTTDQIMKAYTDAKTRLLLCPPTLTCGRIIKRLQLSFYLIDPYLTSIGNAVGDAVKSGETEWLEFAACADVDRPSDDQLVLFGQRLMSFSNACPGAFKALTKLTLQNLAFENSDVTNLLNTCNKLKLLSLRSCELVQESSLEIDAPCSELGALELICFGCIQVDLICLPKLRQLVYDTWYGENPSVSCGCVPQLDQVCLASPALSWQTPFVLSQCLSSNSNMTVLHLNFRTEMIWIKPEDPRHLRPIFSKLRDVHLYNIFAECDLNWTLFILEGAPSLENLYLSRHSCKLSNYEDSASKTNLVWETSNFKHLNLKLLAMEGFEEVEKVMNYIRLVMEQAVSLKRIELPDKIPCKKCNAINLELPRFPVDELSKQRVREKLSYGLSSSAEIIIG
ncbi:hypothetical protein VPH35_019952 [Triticum aestivum]